MARSTKITDEAFAAAIEALAAKSIPVTNKSLQAHLGGSMSTIVPMLAAWRQSQRERDDLAEVEVPSEISLAAEDLAARVWRSAAEMASTGHEALRRELLASRAETDALRTEMIDLIQVVEAERDDLHHTVEEMTADLEAKSAVISDAQVSMVRLTERLEAADRRAQDAEARILKADGRADAAEVRADAAEARAARAEARADRLEESQQAMRAGSQTVAAEA